MSDALTVRVFWSDEDDCYVATSDAQPRTSAFGATPAAALTEYAVVYATCEEIDHDAR